ncbi:MAG: hypothetical protein V4616_03905 [Bacteroidota bacterium]
MRPAYILLIIGLLVLSVLITIDADAQCAMCKATTESSLKEENGQAGNGINKGILYIMFVPYSLLMLMIGIFFRKNVKGFLKQLGLIR